ncbi:hypothetical protein AJ87_35000 [Rhizobium yanglingense]|nr:hypothetical protein AJ87_35000 [Rhizobium yanglingense]
MTQSVAIVTGAAGDIGAAIAARLADDHDIVLLADIDLEAAAAVAAALGRKAVSLPPDATSPARRTFLVLQGAAPNSDSCRRSSTMPARHVLSAFMIPRLPSGAWTMPSTSKLHSYAFAPSRTC